MVLLRGSYCVRSPSEYNLTGQSARIFETIQNRVSTEIMILCKQRSIVDMEKKNLAGAACLIAATVLYGIMPLLSKTAYRYGSNGNTAAFFRFLSCTVILGILVAVMPHLYFRVPRKAILEILLLSVFYGVTPVLLFSSYEYIGSGLASTLHFIYPVMVMLVTGLFFHSGFQKLHLFCIVLCMAGILCFYTPGESMNLAGMAFAITSGCTFALYMVFLGRSGLGSFPILTVTFWLSLFSTFWIGLLGLVSGSLTVHVGWQAHLAHLGLGFFSTVVALALFQKGVFLCGSVKAALLSTFEPLTGVVIGLLVYHEDLTVKIALGIFLILISTVLLVLRRTDSEPEAADRV